MSPKIKTDLTMPLLASAEQKSIFKSLKEIIKLAWEIIKVTPDYILSYDFSLMLIAFGFILSRIGEELTAPDLLTALNMYGYVSFMACYAAIPKLSQNFGEISVKVEKIATAKAAQATNNNNQDKKEEFNNQMLAGFDIALQTEIDQLRDEISQKIKTTSRIPRNVFYAALIYDMPFIVSMLFIKEILIGLGQDKQIAASVQKFLFWYLLGFGATLVRIPLEITLLGYNKQKITKRIAMTSLLCTIACEIPASIYFGLDALAAAAAGGLVITAFGFSLYIANSKELAPYSFLRDFTNWQKGDCAEILFFIKEAFPTVFASFSDIVIPLVIAISVYNTLGNEALEKQNKVVLASTFNILISAATSTITSIKVSQGRGKLTERQADKAAYLKLQEIVYSGITANLLLQLPLAIFVCATPSTFITMMGSSAESDDIRYLLMLYFLYMITDNIRFLGLNSMRGLDNNFWSSLISTFFLWLGVGAIYLVENFAELDLLDIPLIMFGAAFCGAAYILAKLPSTLRAAHKSDKEQRIKNIVVDENDADIEQEEQEDILEKNQESSEKEINKNNSRYSNSYPNFYQKVPITATTSNTDPEFLPASVDLSSAKALVQARLQ